MISVRSICRLCYPTGNHIASNLFHELFFGTMVGMTTDRLLRHGWRLYYGDFAQESQSSRRPTI